VLKVAIGELYGTILVTLIDDTLYVVVVVSDEQAFSDELYRVVSQSFSIDESLGASSAIDIDDLLEIESSSSALDLLFEESFDDNARDWEVYTDGTIFSDFVDGSYQIQLTNFSSRWYVLPGFENWSLAPTFTEPYELEFEISDVQSSTGHYELLILFDGQEGYDGTKALHITSSGTYYRGVVATGTQTGTQARPFDPSFDLLDGQTHQIRLQVWEDRYVVFIDDTQLFEQPSIGPISGSVGFGFGVLGSETATLSIRFDNLIVRRL
jgi:hypothetical protein